ncbi:hypothetical protein SKA53_04988 [Yoonia vestfoldensis SKA53]|uniref:Uncharacterized protein n=1 Tax=Yoonia vestfoldensis SKA53 TaxID=314232 RepID=A3V691_9RHOB|nr:hypothetical protein SKA53_04988 [Yoonia vestfoldensis SKA53]
MVAGATALSAIVAMVEAVAQ